MAKTGLRDEIVLATKYTAVYKGLHDKKMRSNYGGNSAKSLHVSVEDSLKKLQTSYIDLVCKSFVKGHPPVGLELEADAFHLFSSMSTSGT